MTDKKIGRYQIQSQLGRGGMATIFLAYDPMFERNVAIKVLPPEYLHDPSFRGRFEREAKTIATLEHPAIVPVYDFGEQGGQPYLVMRYMRGGSLEDRLERGAIPIPEATKILERIGSALDHAHKSGIVHRDLKPANILFDEYGDAFLADFGIVKITEATSNLTGGGIIGTPAYMSPEQIHGDKEVDGRSDIYALGVILFEMLTGQMPYRADTPAKLMMAHVLNPTPRILEVRPDLPQHCNDIISKAMAKDRDARFGTAKEMATVLTTGSMTRPNIPKPEPPPPPAATAIEPRPQPVQLPRIDQQTAGQQHVDQQTELPEKEKRNVLLPAVGGAIALIICCGIAIFAAFQFGGLGEQVDADATATALAIVADQPTETPESTEETPQATPAEEIEPTATEALDSDATESTVANQTATAQANLDATREAEQTATAEAQATANAQAEADASADATATAIAEEATAEVIEVNNVLADITQAVISQIQETVPVSGPEDGELPHEDDGFIETFYIEDDLQDFVAEATFVVPYTADSDNGWDFGFMFRDADADDQYRLTILSDGYWELTDWQPDDFFIIHEGQVDNLNTGSNETNHVTLYAEGTAGYFFLNDQLISVLDLSDRLTSGGLAVGTGFFLDNEIVGQATPFVDFTVWASGIDAPPPGSAGGGDEEEPPPPPPPVSQRAQLLGSMRAVRTDLERIGGLIDGAVASSFVDCEDIVSTYDRIAGAPFYNGLSGEELSAHNQYRTSIDIFTNGARDMAQNCRDFISNGNSGTIPFNQWGRARQSVNDALDVLNPAIASLE